ncbi:hypothetical protein Fmac_026249 [Flemingia macrophylla]|uniref:WAT1-related protein n=1 Tax=Flemingia macrophylla TaxID=520843 RepID=A0ABD1LEB4_9FABA
MGVVNWIPFVAMVTVECLDVGLTTLGKAAISEGMNHFIFVLYSNALASLILLPSSFIFDANRPPLSFSLLSKFFFLALIGITIMQNCVFTAVDYSSPLLGSAMTNLTPAITFVLAVILRMEKLNIRSSISQIKVMGAVVSISGALIITLYKGSAIRFRTRLSPSLPLPYLLSENENWLIGGFFFAVSSVSFAVWYIAQASILKGFSSQLTIVAFYCLFGTIQTGLLCLIVVRDRNDWKISPNIELIAIFYSAIVGSAGTAYVMTWCIKRKGPVFVSMFKPVGIAIAAFSTVVFLGETLHVGSIIGATIIAIGFYAVLWAQSKEDNANGLQVDRQASPSSQSSPLIESNGSIVLA